jgi:hypothetical protein
LVVDRLRRQRASELLRFEPLNFTDAQFKQITIAFARSCG